MDRKQLKAQSKTLIRTAQPKPVVTAIIYILILAVLSFLSYEIAGDSPVRLQKVFEEFGFNYDVTINDDTYNYNYDLNDVDPDQLFYAVQEAVPTPTALLLGLAIQIVTIVLGGGFAIFCLRTVRGMEASYWNIFDAFGMFLLSISRSSFCASSRYMGLPERVSVGFHDIG